MILSATSLTLSAATISRLSRSTIGFGVLAGRNAPTQKLYSASGSPASATVGTSGISGSRLAELTASALTLPSLASGDGVQRGRRIDVDASRDDFGHALGRAAEWHVRRRKAGGEAEPLHEQLAELPAPAEP